MAVLRTRRVLEPAGVDAVLEAGVDKALQHGYRVVIAVVDGAGELIGFRRTPRAQIASSRVAHDKARTAAIFMRPSREIEEQVTNGRLGALALHGARALTGGIPLRVDGEVVGAVGCSGETPAEDEAVAVAAAASPLATVEQRALTEEGASLVAAAVARVARERSVGPVAAVVDAAGELMYLWRPDDAQVASVGVASDKARTAAIYRRPSKDFEDQASGGRPSALHLARAVPLQGGMPIIVDGQVVGAVGVSGASSADEDQDLAVTGAQALRGATEPAASHFSADDVAAAFARGGLLLDTPAYKIDAGRRDAPGEAEYHERVVDVMHVVRGEATVAVAGRMIDAHEVAAGERRASALEGATEHHLAEGDVVAIPSGVPHQFTAVSDPFLYLVVKVVG